MGRLARFLHLERARPDAQGGDPPGARTPQRFAAIEPRRETPTAEPDPFAPPPDAEVELQIVHEQLPEVDRAKADKRARAEALVDAAQRERADVEQERAEQQVASPVHRLLELLVRMGNYRFVLIGGILLVTLVLADVVGPAVWLVAPMLIGVIVASFAARKA